MLDLESYLGWILNQRSTRECVEKLVSDDDPVRLLYLCGRGKCGKSEVLRWFAEKHSEHIFGTGLISFHSEKNGAVLVEEIADSFRDEGVLLTNLDALADIVSIKVEAYINEVTASNAPNSVFKAEANVGGLSQAMAGIASKKLRALLEDLETACASGALSGYLLFNGFDDADEETKEFFRTRVLRGLSKFPGLRFVIEEGPGIRMLEESARIDAACHCMSSVLAPTVTKEDIITYFAASPPKWLPKEMWDEKAQDIIEKTQGYPDTVISHIRYLY